MNLKNYLSNELFRASFMLLILLNIANFLNYLFQFAMGRMLGPAEYGILATLSSIIYIFTVPTSAIQTMVARHSTRFKVHGENGRIKGMLKFLLPEAIILAGIIFLIFCALSWFLTDSLKISFWLLSLTGFYLFGAFLAPIGLGILQGMKKFSAWGWNSILNSAIKIILAIVLVLLGFGVYGPIIGFILGALLSFAFIFPCIKEVLNSREVKEQIQIISRENIGLLGAMLIITLMYSLDIIFAKAFFSPDIAGKYSVASMIGKIIIFGTLSISGAMFPISSERFLKENKEKTASIIKKTFAIISVLCLIAVFLLLIFPAQIIGLLFGNAYVGISNILVYIGIAFSFLSLTNAFILYKLSIYEFRIRHAFILGLFLIIEIASFFIFGKTPETFSIAFMASAIITFLGSILFIKKK